MKNSDIYALDHHHPIPDLDVVDINTVKKGGGSDLFIVIAETLADDERSLQRLLRKIERYLEFLHTSKFRIESGLPTPENTNIIVKIHRDSSSAAFDLLERSKSWVADNHATLLVDATIPMAAEQSTNVASASAQEEA
jgi:hypothetical protein